MRLLGVIGGMSAESTAIYYAKLNEGVRSRLGGLHSARIILWSVDFAEVARLQAAGEWEALGRILANAAKVLEKAGAEAIVLATNTMHKVAPAIEAAISVPLLHIADATGTAITKRGLRRPALLATAYTMEQDFYKERLASKFGLEVLVPESDERREVHRIIYDELCKGVVAEPSRQTYVAIARRLRERGADSLILGCTEVGMLLNQANVPMPVFDTTLIHVEEAVSFALQGQQAMAAE
jgi:aspartate racemase